MGEQARVAHDFPSRLWCDDHPRNDNEGVQVHSRPFLAIWANQRTVPSRVMALQLEGRERKREKRGRELVPNNLRYLKQHTTITYLPYLPQGMKSRYHTLMSKFNDDLN